MLPLRYADASPSQINLIFVDVVLPITLVNFWLTVLIKIGKKEAGVFQVVLVLLPLVVQFQFELKTFHFS